LGVGNEGCVPVSSFGALSGVLAKRHSPLVALA
jgi:hypothetical protein